jgi:hypothetical protein
MYSNLAFSIIGLLFNLAGSATVTAFIITAKNIVNLFGSSLGLDAEIGYNFLILTWTSCALALLANIYVLAVWFFQFRTISVQVQRLSPRDTLQWEAMAVPDSSETMVSGRPAPAPVQQMVMRPTRNSFRNSRSKSISQYTDF